MEHLDHLLVYMMDVLANVCLFSNIIIRLKSCFWQSNECKFDINSTFSLLLVIINSWGKYLALTCYILC